MEEMRRGPGEERMCTQKGILPQREFRGWYGKVSMENSTWPEGGHSLLPKEKKKDASGIRSPPK